MGMLGGQPILILKEGTERTTGRDAQRNNILAARTIAEAIKSALGPKGADKMLVDSFGDVTITNDGATILKELDVQHPAAKFVIDLAKTQDAEVGDGTTSVVIIAGELLKRAEDLLDAGIHPSVIVEGYQKGAIKAMEVLDGIAKSITFEDDDALRSISNTSMCSKLVSGSKEALTELVVKAVKAITEDTVDGKRADIDQILIQKKKGGALEETILVDGIVLDKEIVHSEMPKVITGAKILLTDKALEISKTEFDAKIRIDTPDQIQAFLDAEQKMLEELVDQVKASGANVILAQKGIDDLVQHYLAKAGIVAVRRIKKSDMVKLAKATGGVIVSDLKNLEDVLGASEKVEQRKVGDDEMIFVEGCKDAKAVTMLIRGGTDMIVDEADRALHDAICVVRQAIQEQAIVAGGGAPEIEVARSISEYARTFEGKITLAIEAYAETMKVIPKTLAENSGLDPIDIVSKLVKEHASGKITYGVDPFSGGVKDMATLDVFEPISSKKQMISSATEAAEMILRIDDVISAKNLGGGGGPPGGGMGEDYGM